MARKRTYKILLSDEDKKILLATIHNKKACKMTIRRCQILLELDENAPQHLTQMQIAKTFGVSKSKVLTISVSILPVKGHKKRTVQTARNLDFILFHCIQIGFQNVYTPLGITQIILLCDITGSVSHLVT